MAEQPYKDIVSGDHKYQVYPLTGRAALHLDRKVTAKRNQEKFKFPGSRRNHG